MSPCTFTRRDIADAKTILSTILPRTPGLSSRLDEAMAAGLGHRTYASLTAALASGGTPAAFDPGGFSAKAYHLDPTADVGVYRTAALQAFARIAPNLAPAEGEVGLLEAVRDVTRARHLTVWLYPEWADLVARHTFVYDERADGFEIVGDRIHHGPAPKAVDDVIPLRLAPASAQARTILNAIPEISAVGGYIVASVSTGIDFKRPRRLERFDLDGLYGRQRIEKVLNAFRSSDPKLDEGEAVRVAKSLADQLTSWEAADAYVDLAHEFFPPLARIAAFGFAEPKKLHHHVVDHWAIAMSAFSGDVDDFDPADRPFSTDVLTARHSFVENMVHILSDGRNESDAVWRKVTYRTNRGRSTIAVAYEQDVPAMQKLSNEEIAEVVANVHAKPVTGRETSQRLTEDEREIADAYAEGAEQIVARRGVTSFIANLLGKGGIGFGRGKNGGSSDLNDARHATGRVNTKFWMRVDGDETKHL